MLKLVFKWQKCQRKIVCRFVYISKGCILKYEGEKPLFLLPQWVLNEAQPKRNNYSASFGINQLGFLSLIPFGFLNLIHFGYYTVHCHLTLSLIT